MGAIDNLVVAPGVTLSGLDAFGQLQTIRNTSNFPSYPSVDGSNTTAGGANFVEMPGGTLVFTFAKPTQFFGAYLTGVQSNFFADSVTFSDGTSQSFALTAAGTSSSVGEIAFLGFTDAGKSISTITMTASSPSLYDAIGVDDVQFQTGLAAVPEPSSMVSILAGLGLIGMSVRRRALPKR